MRKESESGRKSDEKEDIDVWSPTLSDNSIESGTSPRDGETLRDGERWRGAQRWRDALARARRDGETLWQRWRDALARSAQRKKPGP